MPGARYTSVQCVMSSNKYEPGICGPSDLGRAARGVCESFSQPLDRSAYGLCGAGVGEGCESDGHLSSRCDQSSTETQQCAL